MRAVLAGEEVVVTQGPMIHLSGACPTFLFYVGKEQVSIPWNTSVKVGDAEPAVLQLMVVKGQDPEPVLSAWTTPEKALQRGDKFTVVSVP